MIMVAATKHANLLPSPTEIRHACAEIRRNWSAEERRARQIGGRLRMRLLEYICEPDVAETVIHRPR
jgi:hypothetical protein